MAPVTLRPTGWRPPAPRRPTVPSAFDIVVGVAFGALAISEIVFNDSVESPWRHLLLGALPLMAIAWRRQYPVTVALLVVLSNLVVNPDYEFTTVLSLVVCCFTVGLETLPPWRYWGLALVLLPFIGGMALRGLVPSDLAAALVFLVGPWTVGALVEQRITTASEAVRHAEQLARDRELQARDAASAERSRIARELHDIVSHSISVVTIQTQAVRRRLGPEHAGEAADLAMVEATAREAMAEMRRLFGVLRADGESASLVPQPGLSELPRLVDSVGAGGPRITLQVIGPEVPLPPGVDLAAYRIAQEGLTNALRHAAAQRIEVTVRYGPGVVEVRVSDDGRGLQPHDDAGHGLVGIRERAALYDGSVELGERPGGGVVLTARIPWGGRA